MTETGLIQTLFSSTWSIILIIFFLGGSIFIHELGHFLAARWRGLKVERFSIGFGPRLFGWTGRDGVDYRVSLLPLGGYVALPQLADMRAIEGAPEAEAEALPPISYTDKMCVAFAGPLFNIILAFVLALLIWGIGRPGAESAQSNVIGYVYPEVQLDETYSAPGPAWEAGIRPGDIIRTVDGTSIRTFTDVVQTVMTGSGRDDLGNPLVVFGIERDGTPMEIPVRAVLRQTNLRSGDYMRHVGIEPAFTLKIVDIMPNSPAERAGLQVGDRLLRADGRRVYSIADLNSVLTEKVGQPIRLGIDRKGEILELRATPESVPYTKPLVRVAQLDETNDFFEVMPVYPESVSTRMAMTDPATPAELSLFEVASPGNQLRNLRVGDRILAVNNQQVTSLRQFMDAVNNSGNGLVLETARRGEPRRIELGGPLAAEVVPPRERVLIGFSVDSDSIIIHQNPLRQFEEKFLMTYRVLRSLFSPSSDVGVQHMTGPVGIARIIHRFSLDDLRLVLWFTILLNINLAVLNLLPIPVLDGGHMAFATLSKIIRRPLPHGFIAGSQGLFMLLLLGLMMYIIFFDSLRWMGDHEQEQRLRQLQQYQIPMRFETGPRPHDPS